MYGVLTTFNLDPGMSSKMFEMGDEIASLFKSAKGMQKIFFFGNDATGEYGGFTTWETKEDAETFIEFVRPKLRTALKGIMIGTPTTKVFFTFEPEL